MESTVTFFDTANFDAGWRGFFRKQYGGLGRKRMLSQLCTSGEEWHGSRGREHVARAMWFKKYRSLPLLSREHHTSLFEDFMKAGLRRAS